MANNNRKFTLSANLMNGLSMDMQYFVTPNVNKVLSEIISYHQAGLHSFTVIGTYGTGKSSFLLNLEHDLDKSNKTKRLLQNKDVLFDKDVEILNILGDSMSLSELIVSRLGGSEGDDAMKLFGRYYEHVKADGKQLLVVIDEFGKVLEHAARYNPEEELYFFQKLTEYINASSRDIMLLTTLHQNFSAYSNGLTQAQKNEWTKVKGRFQEVVFAEPVEQLLYLAAEQLSTDQSILAGKTFIEIHKLATRCKYITSAFDKETACHLYPLDAMAAYSITQAIQRYGQNERSLFTFLNSRGEHSVQAFQAHEGLTYNLAVAYDYIVNTFYSYLNDVNADSMGWTAIRTAIERVESSDWSTATQMTDAIKIVKAIGMVNLFGNGGFTFNQADMCEYARQAMDIKKAEKVISDLLRLKIIRYAEYRNRLILFEGTDINIEEEILHAGTMVPRPVNFVDDLRLYFNNRVSPVKASYYHKGTPRYFEYMLQTEAIDVIPTGDVDGYVQMIFPVNGKYFNELMEFSMCCEHAIIFAYFRNTEQIVEHLYKIQKYRYIIDKVLVDKSDRVALKELTNLTDYEKTLLNKAMSESMFTYSDNVTWVYKGKERQICSHREFNRLLSEVCDDVYSKTPVINNELFNKHKLSSNIAGAKAKYLQVLLRNSDKVDLGFEEDKFPPEKTIYCTLLKNTGLHVDGAFTDKPSNPDIETLWNVCEEFLKSTMERPRKLSELVKILSAQPYKIKDGVLEFWIPTYLYIKRQDYSLFGENGKYIPNFNDELLELMRKHMGEFKVKAYAVDGVKLQLFNQYRQFLNLGDNKEIKGDAFIETIKPFLYFYNKQLNEYAKNTKQFGHVETLRFREVLAHAKDPEKAFLEDLPEALGYDDEKLRDEDAVKDYCRKIQRAVRELRDCYNQLIERIEDNLIKKLGLESGEYTEYIVEIQQRLKKVKPHLLTPRQKEFYQHAIAQFDKRNEWYQSVCYAVLDAPLERLRDEQEPKLHDDLVFLFKECEQKAVLSESVNYKIDEAEEARSQALEAKIDAILSGDKNLDVYTLMRILQKRISNE